mgnify:CR=1 FL=1
MVEEYSGYDRPREGWKATYTPEAIVLEVPNDINTPVNSMFTPEHLTEMWRRAKALVCSEQNKTEVRPSNNDDDDGQERFTVGWEAVASAREGKITLRPSAYSPDMAVSTVLTPDKLTELWERAVEKRRKGENDG